MIDTNIVRHKVLELAFQGKITNQSPQDGTGIELYKRIQEEKRSLEKKGIVKKSKTFPEVLEADKPYDLPENWTWVRLGNIVTLQSGQDLKPTEYNDKQHGIPYLTGASNFGDKGELVINRWTEYAQSYAYDGDLLITCKGTVGNIAFLHEKKVHIARQFMGIHIYVLNPQYLKYFIESKIECLKVISKGLIPGIERSDVLNLIMPLPPLKEQKRIVKRLDSIYSVLYEITELQSQYATDRDVLKIKVIDAAISGKLTSQLLTDGNAKDLMAEIKKEKDDLIKHGDIPKEKESAKISDEEMWQEAPENWCYARVQDVALYITDYVANGSFAELKANTKTYKEPNYAIFVRTLDLGAEFKNVLSYIDKKSYDFLKKSKLYGGELILPNIGASIGKAFIMPDLGMPMSLAPNAIMIKFQTELMNRYFYYYFLSSRGQGVLTHIQGGAATAKFSKTDLRKMVLLLPPIKEQERIVNILDDLLSNLID